MNKPHKHAELIKAWADGAEIQYWSVRADGWVTAIDPNWTEDIGFRIKPEPKPDVVKLFELEAHPLIGMRFHETDNSESADIKCTFDAYTCAIKDIEVIS